MKPFDWQMTLQESVFVRLINAMYPAWQHAEKAKGLGQREGLLARLAETRADPEQFQRFSHIPIYVPTSSDPALHTALQDLANILAVEADRAFYEEYYPRLPDVDVPDAHVERVMVAMQREMEREALRRRLVPVVFTDLPWERQCALAERRRYWMALYGINAETWQHGKWSLWEVSSETLLPEDVRKRFQWG